MATKPTTTPVPATTKVTYVQAVGTKADPATPFRKLRQAKGYGRVACAKALKVTTSALWKMEIDPKADLKALQALPQAKPVAKPVKATAKPQAPKPSAPKVKATAKPVDATSLI